MRRNMDWTRWCRIQPLEYDTIQVTAPTNLALISDLTDTLDSGAAATEPGAAARDCSGRFRDARSERHGRAGRRPAWIWFLRSVAVPGGCTAWKRARAWPPLPAASTRRLRPSRPQINLAGAEPAPGDSLLIPAAYHESIRSMRAAVTAASKGTPFAAHSGDSRKTARPSPATTLPQKRRAQDGRHHCAGESQGETADALNLLKFSVVPPFLSPVLVTGLFFL